MYHDTFFIYLALMAATTYLIRALPLVCVKHKIRGRYIRSFLTYIPYAVLTAMTIPAIFSSTGSYITAAIGFIVAVATAYMDLGLLPVAIASCLSVYLAQLLQ